MFFNQEVGRKKPGNLKDLTYMDQSYELQPRENLFKCDNLVLFISSPEALCFQQVFRKYLPAAKVQPSAEAKRRVPPTQGKTWKPYFCPFFFDLHFFKRRPGAVESSNAECKYLHLCKISHCFWSLVITRHLFIAILTWWISYIQQSFCMS